MTVAGSVFLYESNVC